MNKGGWCRFWFCSTFATLFLEDDFCSVLRYASFPTVFAASADAPTCLPLHTNGAFMFTEGEEIATLEPRWSPSILRYAAVVGSATTEVEVESFTADKYASTSIIGRVSELSRVVKLNEGKATVIRIEVTAADGITTATTTITVTRLSRDCTMLGGLG